MAIYTERLRSWWQRAQAASVEQDVGITTGGNLDLEPIVVCQAANLLEAQVIQGRLVSENIPTIVRGEALGSIYGFTTGALAAVDVLVPAPLAEKALAILTDSLTDTPWVDEDDTVDNTVKDELEAESLE